MRGWTIHVPEMPVIMKTDLGMEFRVKTQPKEMDLASAMNIDIITDESLDMIVSIALPGLMVLLTLPITLTRYKVQKVNDIHLKASPRYLSFHKPKVMS